MRREAHSPCSSPSLLPSLTLLLYHLLAVYGRWHPSSLSVCQFACLPACLFLLSPSVTLPLLLSHLLAVYGRQASISSVRMLSAVCLRREL